MTPQTSVGSPFGYRSTAQDVIAGIDLSGKVAVVTGGYSGLGTETVRALAGAGARVFVAARRPENAANDLADVGGDLTILPMDLGDPASIAHFAATLTSLTDAVHIIINNAAIMACPLARDGDGHESQFATNHLGHFRFVGGLWGLLKPAGGARVVTLSSSAHARNGLDLDDLDFVRRTYDKWQAYAQSKSANALFAMALDERGKAHGIRSFAVDPGGIRTPLQRSLTMDEQIALGWYDADGNLNPLFKSVEEGAATSIWCAVSPLLDGKGGVFAQDCDVAAPWQQGAPMQVGVHAHVRDAAIAERLWSISEQWTGVRYI